MTGCNSGIGHEVAKIAVKDGYKVYALDIVLGDKLKSLESEGCNIGQVDVASPESIAKIRELIGTEPIDLLFNIAGKSKHSPLVSSLDHGHLPSGHGQV